MSRIGHPVRPVRIAHLGTGNFFRAHQAWYTEHAADAADWGIAAFAGRSGGVVADLAARDGLYTLVVRAADGDLRETISALSTVSADLSDWRRCFADPQLALVTITVTEAGYRRDADGGLDMSDPAVVADIDALREQGSEAEVTTAPGKLVLGAMIRRERELPALAIVPCDNVPENGPMVGRVVGELAEAVDPQLAAWVDEHYSFVTTMVDRITPQTTTEVEETASVVTEPFSEWVLCGGFPHGRPRWEDAGARFVDDITAWESRKLWLLNGSHSLMAYAGSLRGHETVFDAVSDPVVRGWIEQWWDEAAKHLSLSTADIEAYRQALITRYQNPRIRHLLAQIAIDGSQKIPIRIVPTIVAELAEGRVPTGAARVIAAWVCHLRGAGAPVNDVAAAELTDLASGDLEDAVQRVLERLGIDDEGLRTAVVAQAQELC
jgi:fructuronate reductase